VRASRIVGLRFQTFYGASNNALRLQLWASICVYLVLVAVRIQLGITTNLTTFAEVLSHHALQKHLLMSFGWK